MSGGFCVDQTHTPSPDMQAAIREFVDRMQSEGVRDE